MKSSDSKIELPGRDLINKSDALLCLHVPSYAENELMHSEHLANIFQDL